MSHIIEPISMRGSDVAAPTNILPNLRIAASLFAGLIILSGCGATPDRDLENTAPTSSAVGDHTMHMVEMLRSTNSYDFEPADSPDALMSRVDVAAVGTVASVESTRIANDSGEDTGGVLVALRPVEVWKAEEGAISENIVFVLRRPTNVGIEAFEVGFNLGAEVVLFGYLSSLPVLRDNSHSPRLYEPDPQGLMVETAEGTLVNVWGEEVSTTNAWKKSRSIDGLAHSMRQAAQDHDR